MTIYAVDGKGSSAEVKQTKENKMKKLMIGMVAAIVGLAANAAVTMWSATDVYKYAEGTSSTKASGYAVYFLAETDYARASAVADLAKSDFAFLANAKEGSDGTFLLTDGGDATNFDVGEYPENLNTTAYMIVFDSSTAAKAEHYYVTASQEFTINGLGISNDPEFSFAATKTGSNWESVPEPTSGLLLLLGVAGLALRRRRA